MKQFVLKAVTLLVCATTLALIVSSCEKERKEEKKLPVIVLDSPNFTYNVKVGRNLTISPTYENAEDAVFVWSEKGKIISNDKVLTYSWSEIGEKYIVLSVTNSAGEVQVEIKINVMQKVPPVINYVAPKEGLFVVNGGNLSFAPVVENDEDASFAWYVNDAKVSDSKEFTFTSLSNGDYVIRFVVANEDGEDEYTFTITVGDAADAPFGWDFEQDTYNISSGRSIRIKIWRIKCDFDATYTFTLNGEEVQSGEETFYIFDKSEEGTYNLVITMNNQSTAVLTKNITINVCPPEGTFKRSPGAASDVRLNKVYEFLAAPGQFVNEGYDATTMEEAVAYAESRLIAGGGSLYLSLGAWGGSVVVGFDHSIENDGDYNIQIRGNSFNGSSEPGVVWVMQDENGDGLPNDTWYELKGSAYDYSNREYWVTYYKPESKNSAVQWSDSEGNSGTVDYLAAFHKQDYYYPNWVNTDTYTIYGVKLPARTSMTGGIWFNGNLEWGYADNFSSVDRIVASEPTVNHFKISDAITWDGKEANLKYIDFIKVQTGVNTKAGILGENSTEVQDFKDYNLIK